MSIRSKTASAIAWRLAFELLAQRSGSDSTWARASAAVGTGFQTDAVAALLSRPEGGAHGATNLLSVISGLTWSALQVRDWHR